MNMKLLVLAGDLEVGEISVRQHRMAVSAGETSHGVDVLK